MRTARRVYLYAVSFISLQAVMWAAIAGGRLLLLFREVSATYAQVIAGSLAILIVGVPFFLIHWLTARRLALADSEERGSAFRAFFPLRPDGLHQHPGAPIDPGGNPHARLPRTRHCGSLVLLRPRRAPLRALARGGDHRCGLGFRLAAGRHRCSRDPRGR